MKGISYILVEATMQHTSISLFWCGILFISDAIPSLSSDQNWCVTDPDEIPLKIDKRMPSVMRLLAMLCSGKMMNWIRKKKAKPPCPSMQEEEISPPLKKKK